MVHCRKASPNSPIKDAEAVRNARDALTITYTPPDTSNSVTTNVSLPTSASHGVTITWMSSDSNYIDINGMVTGHDRETSLI